MVTSAYLDHVEKNGLYMKDGKPHHEYNFFALERTNIAGQ